MGSTRRQVEFRLLPRFHSIIRRPIVCSVCAQIPRPENHAHAGQTNRHMINSLSFFESFLFASCRSYRLVPSGQEHTVSTSLAPFSRRVKLQRLVGSSFCQCPQSSRVPESSHPYYLYPTPSSPTAHRLPSVSETELVASDTRTRSSTI
jgi:hypothetical protein